MKTALLLLVMSALCLQAGALTRTNDWGTATYSVHSEKLVKWLRPDAKTGCGLARMGWRTYPVENLPEQWPLLTNQVCALVRKEVRVESYANPVVSYFLMHHGSALADMLGPVKPTPPARVILVTHVKRPATSGAPAPPEVHRILLTVAEGIDIEPPVGLHDELRTAGMTPPIQLRILKTDRNGNVMIGLTLPANTTVQVRK